MKAPKFSARLRLSELMPRATRLATLLLASACHPGPHHPASPGPPLTPRHHVGEWYESDSTN
jgi:hypothetical protein